MNSFQFTFKDGTQQYLNLDMELEEAQLAYVGTQMMIGLPYPDSNGDLVVQWKIIRKVDYAKSKGLLNAE